MNSYERATAALEERHAEIQGRMDTRINRSRAILAAADAEKRAVTAEEDAELKRLDGEMTQIEEELRYLPRNVAIKMNVPEDDSMTTQTTATRDRWVDLKSGREVRALRSTEKLTGTMNFTREERSLRLGHFLRGLITGNWSGAEPEHRAAMTTSTFTAAGALVPAPLSARLWDLARNLSVIMRAGAQTIPMESSTLDIARIVGDPTAFWTGGDEVRTAGLTESGGTFGRATFQAQTLAILERVSVELAEDAPNMPQLLEDQVAKALAIELDRAIINGFTTPGFRDGLRTWLTNDSAGSPNSLNEISMGTNGAQITDYSNIISGIQKVLEGNFPGNLDELSLVISPRVWGTIEGLKNATTFEPLRPPPSVAGLKKLVSKQLPINETQGNVSTASTLYVGDFSQVAVGVRTDTQLEVSRVAGDAFQRLHVLIRGYLRGDWQVIQPKWITRIIGILP